MRRALPFVLLAVFFAAFWSVLPRRDLSERANVNLVLIITCTLRADQTSLRTGLDTTPTLARWASEGADFSQVIATAPWTRAASTALLTGRSASELGLSEPKGGANSRALPLSATTLAEALHDAGWNTLGATANPNLNPEFQFDQGFDEYRGLTHLWRNGMEKIPGSQVIQAAVQMLDDADATRPTYLQLLFVDAHAPNEATAEEVAAFMADGLPMRVAAYRAQVRRLDDTLAELETALATRGLTDENTIFAVVSDHGEGLRWPNHHGMGHGLYLYPSTVHVPFVLRGPGVPAGIVVDGVVSGTDIAPTLAELVGVGFEGHSHAPALRGEQTGRPHAFAATWFRSAHRGAVYTRDTACQRDYTPNFPAHPSMETPTFETGCFDRVDRTFTKRSAPNTPLQATLDEWFKAQEAHLAQAAVERGEVADDLEAALRALGYATDEGP